MKYIKFSIIVFLFILTTGCLLGSVGKGYLTKICTKTEEFSNVLKQEEITIIHKDNKIVTIHLKKDYQDKGNKYVFQNFKDSTISEISSLNEKKGIEVENIVDTKQQYSVLFTFHFSDISDNIKEVYKFQEQFHFQIKDLEGNGYICK